MKYIPDKVPVREIQMWFYACVMQAAMDFVVEEDLKAHLTCWYIQKYVKENPQPQYFEHIYQ